MTLDFKQICRLCLEKRDNLAPLFCGEEALTLLSTRLIYLIPELKIHASDGLPTQVCRRCIRLINLTYRFKQQCESSDVTLRQYLKAHMNEENGNVSFNSKLAKETVNILDYSEVKIEASGLGDVSSDDDLGNEIDDKQSLYDIISNEAANPREENNRSMPALKAINIKIKPDGKKATKNSSSKAAEGKVVSEESANVKKTLDANKNAEETKKLTTVKRRKRGKGDKKGYLCQDCGKNFTYETHLLLHRRTHTGEKPFSCSICGECFSVSSNMYKHMRIHTGEKPFLCTYCGKSFSRSDTLTKHARSHTGEKPFQCAICGNNFGRRSILTNHIRTHSGEKPYLCTECGQRFSQSYDLTKHMRSHSGEKPYCCTVCKTSFGQRNSLTKHMKIHAPEIQFPLDVSKGISYKLDTVNFIPHADQVRLLSNTF